jgi:hypothetical protein
LSLLSDQTLCLSPFPSVALSLLTFSLVP